MCEGGKAVSKATAALAKNNGIKTKHDAPRSPLPIGGAWVNTKIFHPSSEGCFLTVSSNQASCSSSTVTSCDVYLASRKMVDPVQKKRQEFERRRAKRGEPRKGVGALNDRNVQQAAAETRLGIVNACMVEREGGAGRGRTHRVRRGGSCRRSPE